MNINIFDGAIIVAAIAGGVTGGIIAAIVSLGVLRSQRHIAGTSIGAPHTGSQWRTPSGPLTRHLAQSEAIAAQASEKAEEAARESEE